MLGGHVAPNQIQSTVDTSSHNIKLQVSKQVNSQFLDIGRHCIKKMKKKSIIEINLINTQIDFNLPKCFKVFNFFLSEGFCLLDSYKTNKKRAAVSHVIISYSAKQIRSSLKKQEINVQRC